jgi:hypothetical protein
VEYCHRNMVVHRCGAAAVLTSDLCVLPGSGWV